MMTQNKLFSTYDAALAFCNKPGMVQVGKPFRRLVWTSIDGGTSVQITAWSVALPNVKSTAANDTGKAVARPLR